MATRALRRALIAAALSVTVMAAGVTATAAAGIELPQGPGVNLVYAQCQTCHDLQYVRDAKGLLPAQWKAVIASMRDYGYTGDADTEAKLIAYLTTYLGPDPAPAALAPANAATAALDGPTLFAENCAGCHGPQGRGQPSYFPPLAGNPDLAADRLLPVLVVLHGLAGSIKVAGGTYTGSMPPLPHLSDEEIAAVVSYVQNAWGNTPPGGGSIDAATVAAQRGRAMTPADVLAYRGRAR
ncbi:MAG: cytochrome c [Casimicrobiaceae bacterium]